MGEDREHAEQKGEAIADTVVGHALVAVPEDRVEGHRLQDAAVPDAEVEAPAAPTRPATP